MLNRVPFGSAWRKVRHCDRQLKFIRKSLQGILPAPTSITIGSTAIGLDQQALRPGIAALSAHQPPASNGRNRKFGGFMRDANQHIATIAPQVVNAVRNGLAFGLAGKIMVVNLQSALPPGPAWILEAPDQLLLFSINANDRVAGLLKGSPLLLNRAKLAITVGIVCAGNRFSIALERVVAFT